MRESANDRAKRLAEPIVLANLNRTTPRQHSFNPGSHSPDACATNGCGKLANDSIHGRPAITVVGSHRIVTRCICPPIPDRRWDWRAHIEGEEERMEYGYGPTESDAVRELLQTLEDDDSLAGWRLLQRASLHIDSAIGEDHAEFGNRRGQGYYLSLADASNLIDDLMGELQQAGEVGR